MEIPPRKASGLFTCGRITTFSWNDYYRLSRLQRTATKAIWRASGFYPGKGEVSRKICRAIVQMYHSESNIKHDAEWESVVEEIAKVTSTLFLAKY